MDKLELITKKDLIWVIHRMGQIMKRRCGWDCMDEAIEDLRYRKEQDRLNQADAAARRADMAMRRYYSILSPYDGMRLMDIPLEILQLADAAQQEAKRAEKEFNRLMEIPLKARER